MESEDGLQELLVDKFGSRVHKAFRMLSGLYDERSVKADPAYGLGLELADEHFEVVDARTFSSSLNEVVGSRNRNSSILESPTYDAR